MLKHMILVTQHEIHNIVWKWKHMQIVLNIQISAEYYTQWYCLKLDT